ncbi:MAG: RNA polymerase sigma factor (sigma-70 family) [Candidatus Krumholzibacteriia bacterium]|jgi:RNA polymerase sigma factor (sigma-70 family)
MVPARTRFHGDDRPLATAILERVVVREPEALDVFFNHYYNRVYAHVVNMVRNPVLGEDLTQEIFLRLYKVIPSLDPTRDATAWVFTVATNVIRDHWRSKEHKRGARELSIEEQTGLHAAHPDPDVQSVMERDEELKAVWSALRGLREVDREIILLRDYEELNTSDICDMLQLEPDAVRQRHSRAVTRLSVLFKESEQSQMGGA